MSTITTRAGKGSPLTNAEVDANFTNLNTDKAELSGAAFTGAITTTSTVDGRDVATDGSKLDGIEAGATADQTAAEIKTAYESNADTNAFTDADESKLDGIEASADVTDAINVEAAGGLMDSELTSIASVKALNQGVATTDSPTFAALTSTGEITANGGIALGDNDKATFGASDDLQIYHTGSDSRILDEGTGNLRIMANNLRMQSALGEQYIIADDGGAVTAYYDNAVKLATTSTGIDVTGTATMDGLTVDATGSAIELSQSAAGSATYYTMDNTVETGGKRWRFGYSGGSSDKGSFSFYNQTDNNLALLLTSSGATFSGTATMDGLTVSSGATFDGGDTTIDFSLGTGRFTTPSSFVFTVDDDNSSTSQAVYFRADSGKEIATFNELGDISFYEDTGTTAKFFWDASAESLGIGTSSVVSALDVLNGGNTYTSGLVLRNGSSTSEATSLYHDNTGSTTTVLANRYGSAASAIKLVLQAASASPVTALTALGNGNVGIGTGSPNGNGILTLNTPTDNSPQIVFSENNTGKWLIGHRHDGDHFRFYDLANSAERMRIDSSGRVGIGTSSPAAKAHIYDASTDAVLYLDSANVNGSHARFLASGSVKHFVGSGGGFGLGDVDDFAIRSFDNLIFATNNSSTERMRIDASGNVGIGTSSPSTKLHLGGTAPLDSIIRQDSTVSGTNWEIGEREAGKWQIWEDDSDSVVATFTSSGNVGIGESSPSGLLHLKKASDTADIILESSGGSGKEYLIGSRTDGSLNFYDVTASTERMRIDSSGNLLVGKTAGNSPATIGFEVQQDGEVYSTIATGYNTYHVYANSAYRFYVNPNGGIYNYAANNNNLSDEREKKNIELLESQWDSLKQWSLKKFHYNADDDSDSKKLGVIAQEVESYNPEIISEFRVDENTTRMAVKEQQMMWMAIKALQEAQTRIETLEARVTELENN